MIEGCPTQSQYDDVETLYLNYAEGKNVPGIRRDSKYQRWGASPKTGSPSWVPR